MTQEAFRKSEYEAAGNKGTLAFKVFVINSEGGLPHTIILCMNLVVFEGLLTTILSL